MSLLPEDHDDSPRIPCPDCGQEVGVVLVDEGTDRQRELLADPDPVQIILSGQPDTNPLWLWVKMFSGIPPRAAVLSSGALHRVHTCRNLA